MQTLISYSTWYLFEMNTIRSRTGYIPWRLIPQSILDSYNEERRDCGIDAVELDGNRIVTIVQIKFHHGTAIRRGELSNFVFKSMNPRYLDCYKLLIVRDCTLSPDLRQWVTNSGITIEEL